MEDQDCYFYVDQTVPEEDQVVSVLCCPCRAARMPAAGWFYRGTVEGYGPHTYACRLCGTPVHVEPQPEAHVE